MVVCVVSLKAIAVVMIAESVAKPQQQYQTPCSSYQVSVSITWLSLLRVNGLLVAIHANSTMSERAQHEREDVPRISVDSLQDWGRIKLSYVEAATKELEDAYVPRFSLVFHRTDSETVSQFVRYLTNENCLRP